jgi:hypothetical protein
VGTGSTTYKNMFWIENGPRPQTFRAGPAQTPKLGVATTLALYHLGVV